MIKALFLMRQDLNMSPAKLAVQVGHGTGIIYEESDPDRLEVWKTRGNYRKIVLKVKSLEKLENLGKVMAENGIQFQSIVDAGYTEFEGSTLTGYVVFPIYEEEIIKPLSRLQLY